ncbi:hypothetical protein C1H46_016834 [Malus baccata]|uniref:Uncharacterized protein n=1 Tax=Malus baccata TaxID=106549 RepID=A0A540MFR8_MALBA|nr:hypothetical protein C1H46_016834 [Malus baccata]
MSISWDLTDLEKDSEASILVLLPFYGLLEGKVSEVEIEEVEVNVLDEATMEEEGYEEEDDDLEIKKLSWSHGGRDFEFRWMKTNGFWIFFAKAKDL